MNRLAAAAGVTIFIAGLVAGPLFAAESLPTKYGGQLHNCRARGGHSARGPFNEHYCKIALPDGGRACTDPTQCVGNCIYGNDISSPVKGSVVGSCQKANSQYGCYFTVRKGRATDPQCGD